MVIQPVERIFSRNIRNKKILEMNLLSYSSPLIGRPVFLIMAISIQGSGRPEKLLP